MGTEVRAALASAVLLLGCGCMASTVVDREARGVRRSAPEVTWGPARAQDLDGLFESLGLEGEAAAALWKLYYHFGADGTYSGAALVFDGRKPAFQTLVGTWRLEHSSLILDEGEPAQAETSGELLRLSSAAGTATFRRVSLQ